MINEKKRQFSVQETPPITPEGMASHPQNQQMKGELHNQDINLICSLLGNEILHILLSILLN